MPLRQRSLHIYEEVMLLALRNDKGTVAGGVHASAGAGGAILAELILEGRVQTVTEGRSTYGVVRNHAPLGDALLDECLQRMATLRAAIAGDTGTVDPRTTVLLALGQHAGLLKAHFDRSFLKPRRKRIEAIVKGDAVGKATKQAIEAVQAAVMVAAVIPAAVASSSSS